MFSAILSRLSTARITLTVWMIAQMLGLVVNARAEEPPKPAANAQPQSTSSPEVRRALREFDRFLDHHPLLEDRLRLDPKLTTDTTFVKENPELYAFLGANPHIAEGLKIYPRYYLNRALLRQASAPVPFRDLAPFKGLFQQQPQLEKELTANPQLIRDPAFLESHAALRDFLVQHPTLAQVFLPPSVPSATK